MGSFEKVLLAHFSDQTNSHIEEVSLAISPTANCPGIENACVAVVNQSIIVVVTIPDAGCFVTDLRASGQDDGFS